MDKSSIVAASNTTPMSSRGIVILGPTASGKTHLAVELARSIEGEIISADSRQVYRGMDIGTGKDLSEYTVDGHPIPYHLIDILDAGKTFNIKEFYKEYERAALEIEARGRRIILCGGSGLYLQTAVEGNALAAIPVDQGMRDEMHKLSDSDILDLFQALPLSIQKNHDSSTINMSIRAIEIAKWLESDPLPSRNNLEIEYRLFGIDIDRELRRARITERLEHRLAHGMIEEVRNLMEHGVTAEQLRWYGLEYKWIVDHLEGKINLPELQSGLESAIHQFAKRQMTFFRSLEKKGWNIHWLDGTKSTEALIQEISSIDRA